MLAGTLFAEAAVCWPVWRHWPNPCVVFFFHFLFAFFSPTFSSFSRSTHLALSCSLSLSLSLSSQLQKKKKKNTSHFAAHVRSHFFCNVGVAAGLLLTRSLGGGVFAADRVVGRKKSR